MSIIKKMGTHLKVTDYDKSRAFYEALGFKMVLEFGPEFDRTEKTAPHKYRGAFFDADDGKGLFEIAEGHIAVNPEVFKEQINSSKVSLMIYVDSLEEIIERSEIANISLTKDPVNYPWRTTEFVIRDPDGFILVFIAPTSEKYKNTYATAQ